jgi:radical SAM protein with 4Fe4S-binding SPASM domain
LLQAKVRMELAAKRYADFSLAFHQRVAAQRVAVNGTIEVTRRCPLTCAHCYNNLPMADQEARLSELTYEEHCRIVDEIVEAGCFWLLYTGGEIFARRDFLDIYTYAKKKGLIITLFTNGTLITPKIADYLVEWRPFAIEITLYGRTKETYEQLTGIPGSYERCMRGISLLMERGLPLKLKTVGVRINKHEIWEMKRFAEDLGLEFKFDSMINPRIDCSQSPLAVRLTPEEIVELDLQDPKRVAEWHRFADKFIGPAHSPEQSDEVYHCGGGINSFAIGPQGRMSICVLSHFDTYDLRKGSFREGWESFLLNVRRKKTAKITKCTACHLKAMCGMCPANGELEHGDPEAPVDFLCKTAHLRAKAFGFPAPPHGECEYCEGGTGYQDLMRSVAGLKETERGRQRVSPVSESPARDLQAPTCGSCSSCSISALDHR